MAEREVRYCTTEDGVSIAYAVTGKGEHWLVHTPILLSAMLQYESIPGRRAWTNGLEEHFKLVQYDARGTGLSQRAVEDLSFEGFVRDLESVVDAASIDRATVFGYLAGTYTAVWYAAAHPERVSHLALWLPPSPGLPGPDTPLFRASTQLALSDWENFTEFLAHQTLGWERGEQSHAYARAIRETVAQETWLRFFGEWYERWWNRLDELYEPASRVRARTLCMQREGYDAFPQYAAPIAGATNVTELASTLPMPVLVIRHLGFRWITDQVTQDLVSCIPDARLVTVKGTWADDPEGVVRRIADFIYEGEANRPKRNREQVPGGLRTILFTDLAASTALTQRLGDAKAQKLVRAHNAIVREALAAHGGSEIKHTGDGIMASFPTASGALDCAVAIQRAVAASSPPPVGEGPGEGSELAIHIGLNAGEPVAEESDLFGTSVQLARRICDHASAGQVLVSNVVRELAAGKGFLFADIGEVVPKGFEEPVRLYEVRWRE